MKVAHCEWLPAERLTNESAQAVGKFVDYWASYYEVHPIDGAKLNSLADWWQSVVDEDSDVSLRFEEYGFGYTVSVLMDGTVVVHTEEFHARLTPEGAEHFDELISLSGDRGDGRLRA